VVLFPPGGATVKDSFGPIGAKIAASLDKEPGPIHVDGYTDSDPVQTLAFPSNFALSEARAKGVAAMLRPHLADPARLTIAAKGAANPIAENDVEEHKAKNRRVEVWIPRAD
jgi:type VI secretion system protein ImpK